MRFQGVSHVAVAIVIIRTGKANDSVAIYISSEKYELRNRYLAISYRLTTLT